MATCSCKTNLNDTLTLIEKTIVLCPECKSVLFEIKHPENFIQPIVFLGNDVGDICNVVLIYPELNTAYSLLYFWGDCIPFEASIHTVAEALEDIYQDAHNSVVHWLNRSKKVTAYYG